MDLPNIERLLNSGWDLTVKMRSFGRFQATVHLDRRNGPDSHHYIGSSVAVALERLEQYLNGLDGSALRR
jgi:hypothetical protein